ncbi:MAG: hypothetical protein K2L07_15040 [Lachnospiraceae bacterium]|nr:hypothetical protein [Lachnospiraceae bacterium]
MKKTTILLIILSMMLTLSACVDIDSLADIINRLEASEKSENTEGANISENKDAKTERTESEDTESADSETADTETADSETDTTADDSNSAVDPDLKAFLDEYEAFMNDYIDFMVKYQDSDDITGMISDYAEIMKDYVYYTEAVEKYEPDEMSAADAAYYIDVTARISKKLVSVSLD